MKLLKENKECITNTKWCWGFLVFTEIHKLLGLVEDSRQVGMVWWNHVMPVLVMVFLLIFWCKFGFLCHNLHGLFQVLVKVPSQLQQLNYFSLWEAEGHPFLVFLLPCSGFPKAGADSRYHNQDTQPLSCWKLTNCQFFQQITILHSLFSKHLNSIMYAHSATRNYRKLIHSSIPRNRIIVLGLVVYVLSELQGTWGETVKLRAMFKGLGALPVENGSEAGEDQAAK